MFRPMCMPAPAGVHLGPAGGGCRVVRLVHAGQLEAPFLVRSPRAGGVRILRDDNHWTALMTLRNCIPGPAARMGQTEPQLHSCF